MFEPLKAVGGVTPVLNADLRGQKPILAEQIGVGQRFYERFSAFQNTELSNSLSLPAEPEDLSLGSKRRTQANSRDLPGIGNASRAFAGSGFWQRPRSADRARAFTTRLLED
jgi:hypothetical protein